MYFHQWGNGEMIISQILVCTTLKLERNSTTLSVSIYHHVDLLFY